MKQVCKLIVLSLCMTLLVGCADSTKQTVQNDSICEQEENIAGYADNLMGVDCYYLEEISPDGFVIRTYKSDSKTVIAESWGFAIDDYIVDINGDGLTELICNTICGGDGHRECYVYTVNHDRIERGSVNREPFSDLDEWGSNAMETWYDLDNEKICVCYSSTEQEEIKTVYVDLESLTYMEWEYE